MRKMNRRRKEGSLTLKNANQDAEHTEISQESGEPTQITMSTYMAFSVEKANVSTKK